MAVTKSRPRSIYALLRKSNYYAGEDDAPESPEPSSEDSDVYEETERPARKRKRASVAKTVSPKKNATLKKKSKKEEENEAHDSVSLDSDALDDDSDADSRKKRKKVKASPKKRSPQKKRKDDEDDSEVDLKDGQTVIGTVVQAPTTGRVPPGRVSNNTFGFLRQLQLPECNDRQWFKLHEPVYRQAEKEWKDFIEEFTPLLIEVDSQIPTLPPSDVIHRIYRDVRFSNDKTPYKTGFSASFSRSGRKGVFAKYHISVKPGGSLIAAGLWCPGRNELQTIRNHITRSPTRLRRLISAPDFVELFGEPKPHPRGQRQNIFGNDDELKTAPKGVDKNHRDIDLLKCRSLAVFHSFTDDEVLDPGFQDELRRIAGLTRPFVHCLNDMMTVQPRADATDSEDEANAA